MGRNTIRDTGKKARIYVTREARTANLAEESTDESVDGPDRWTELADVRLYGFSGLMLAVNPEKISPSEIAELVASAARDTGSIFLGVEASIRPAGNGYVLSLPGHDHAGFRVGDDLSIHTAPDLLVLTPYCPEDGSDEDDPTTSAFSNTDVKDRMRLVKDLLNIREDQAGVNR